MGFALEKWHGLGNDYLIASASLLPGPLGAAQVALLCDRHRGVGADGILVCENPTGVVPGAVARMRVINPDGSEAEMCGNGARMFARYLAKHGLVQTQEFLLETLAGPIRVGLLPEGLVRVDMGKAKFISAAIDLGYLGDASIVQKYREEVANAPLSVGGYHLRFTFVDVGNPHCVIPVENVDDFPVEVLGPQIECLPLFPRRTNVEFVELNDDGSVTMRVWERGVGETQACGTGASAVGAAMVKLGLAKSPVVVHLPGGDLVIEIEMAAGVRVLMSGPAEEICRCELGDEFLEKLGWNK